jgi:hypothetical protein
MNVRRKGLKESGHGFCRGLSRFNPRCVRPGDCSVCRDRWEPWKFYPTAIRSGSFIRALIRSIAQRACIDSLLQGRRHLSRTKDGFGYQIIGALGTYRISFRVLRMEDQIVGRTTTRLKVHRPFDFPEFVRDIYCPGPRRDPLASRGKIHLSQIGPGTGASYFSFERPDAGSALYFQT